MLRSWRVAKHPEPVRAERADARVLADISGRDLVPVYESLAAHAEAEDLFRIDCIPFFAQDIALDDIVRVRPASGRRPPTIAEVVEPSGRTVFRIWFGRDSEPLTRLECEDRLEQMRALLEKQSENLYAVDAADDRIAEEVFAYLHDQESHAHLAFETGHTA